MAKTTAVAPASFSNGFAWEHVMVPGGGGQGRVG
jgi:hypothetical protein